MVVKTQRVTLMLGFGAERGSVPRISSAGYSLVELVIVIIFLVILAAVAMNRISSLGDLTVASQAQKFAADVQHAQTLAYTSGQRIQVNLLGSAYQVEPAPNCLANLPCPQSFKVGLEQGVTIIGSPNPLIFSTLGLPANAASYTVGGSAVVTVDALTGRVVVN